MTSTETVPRRPGLALAVLTGALALDVSGLGVLNAALPSVGAHFDLDDATLQWVMTAYAVTFAGFLLVGGRLADVFGRRTVFELGSACSRRRPWPGPWRRTPRCCSARGRSRASARPCRVRPHWPC